MRTSLTTVATWCWSPPLDLAEALAFLRRERVTEVFLGVGWLGPDAAVLRAAAALRAAGMRVAALGGTSDWALEPEKAGAWAGRLAGSPGESWFDGVHLDIEPWTLELWPGNEGRLLVGLRAAVEQVRAAVPGLPIEADLVPWLATAAPAEFHRLLRALDRVTLLAYRDRATAILGWSQQAREVLTREGTGYRLAVETRERPLPHETFFDDGRAVLRRETNSVLRQLDGDSRLRGLAVHDAEGWLALQP